MTSALLCLRGGVLTQRWLSCYLFKVRTKLTTPKKSPSSPPRPPGRLRLPIFLANMADPFPELFFFVGKLWIQGSSLRGDPPGNSPPTRRCSQFTKKISTPHTPFHLILALFSPHSIYVSIVHPPPPTAQPLHDISGIRKEETLAWG